MYFTKRRINKKKEFRRNEKRKTDYINLLLWSVTVM